MTGKFTVPVKRISIVLGVVILLGIISFKVVKAVARGKKQDTLAAVHRDICYVAEGNDPFQSMDIYLPKKPRSKPIPVVVWIHGGAWVSGDKNHPPAGAILERGYAVASLNYRLSNRDIHPAQIYDCKAAIRFLRAHAKQYDLDPDRIGVWGHSAGGHLSALLATSGDVKELEGALGNNEQSSRVQAAVEWAGPTDLSTCAAQAPRNCKIDFSSPSNPIAVLMGPNQSPVSYLAASPVQYASKDDPPLLIVHAEDDDVVPVGQAKELSELFKKLGCEQKTQILSHGGHALSNPDLIDMSMDFFDDKLSKK